MGAVWGVLLGVLLVIAVFTAFAEELEAVGAALLVVSTAFAVMAAFTPRWRPLAWGLLTTLVLATALVFAFIVFVLPGEPT